MRAVKTDFVSCREAETQDGNTEEVSRIPKQFQEKFRTMMETELNGEFTEMICMGQENNDIPIPI